MGISRGNKWFTSFYDGTFVIMGIEVENREAKIGKLAPSFRCTAVDDEEFVEIELKKFLGQYVVLFFYPLDFTFVCPTEIIAFSEAQKEFSESLNCKIIAASCDSNFSHLAWINTNREEGGLGEMNIPIISDTTQALAKSYGVLKEDEGISYRGLFIIDTKGIIRQVTINDLPVGRSVAEVKRLIQAFQFVDQYGEVCPADWQPGEETMVPKPNESKAYFEKVNKKE